MSKKMLTQEFSKAAVLGALLKVDVGNPNAGWTEGIVTVIKKVERPDGKTHPYISGQALRRYLRDTLGELPEVKKGEISPIKPTADPKAPIVTEGDPEKYIDDDIFGFMRAIKAGTKRRESPLRVSPAYGLFPYTGDRDLGTRSALEATGELRGSMFETEITNNIFRTILLLELDRIGKWKAYEVAAEEAKEGEVDDDERKRRASLLFKAVKYLWGGGRRSRLLVDLTPQFLIYARMKRKVPIFLNNLHAEFENGRYKLDVESLDEVIDDYKADIQRLIVGVRKDFITNLDQIQKIGAGTIPVKIYSVGEAIDEIQKDIESSSF